MNEKRGMTDKQASSAVWAAARPWPNNSRTRLCSYHVTCLFSSPPPLIGINAAPDFRSKDPIESILTAAARLSYIAYTSSQSQLSPSRGPLAPLFFIHCINFASIERRPQIALTAIRHTHHTLSTPQAPSLFSINAAPSGCGSTPACTYTCTCNM